MNGSGQKGEGKRKVNEITIFPVPFTLGEIKENISISTNTSSKPSKEQIINQAIQFHLKANIPEASKYYQYCINQGCNDHRVFSNYGIILFDLGKLQEAELSYRKAIEIKPDYAEAYYNLGNVLNNVAKLKEAELSYRKAIEIKPDYAEAYYNLGNVLNNVAKLKEAELSYRKAIKIKPDYAEAHLNLGSILIDLGKLKEAELLYRKAIKIKPNYAEAHLNLGTILRDNGKLKEAVLLYRKAIEIKPDYAEAHYNLFCHYEQINNLKKLKESLNEFNKIDSIKNELLLFNARLSFRNKEHKNAKKLIDSIATQWIEKSNHNQKRIFWSYKAFIEDKIGNYDIAYSCFEKSQKNPSYDRLSKDSYLGYINSYKKSIINKKTIINKFNDGIEDSNIAFLIGFPRSGTTLLDTILRSHKDIEVIEEKPLMSTIENLIKEKFNTKVENIFNISKDKIIILRQQYFELLTKYKTKNVNLFIDKFPLNTVCIPLINLIFPNAKIIFTHRQPYDTVLSCFQQSFKPNIAMANLVSLKSSSIIYDQIMSAWDIYKNNLPFDFITSKYEHLIEDFDGHTLKVLEFLGVGWDENVKNYRKTALDRGKINTPSSSQVVQPLYKSSIEKWKNYEKYFEDCHQYLEKWVSYFDY